MNFPYQMTEGQQQIISSLSTTQPVIIESGTGTGKTIATLFGVLQTCDQHDKILYIVRTINQMNAVLREWALMDEILILPLLGTSQFKTSQPTISLKRLKAKNHRHRLLKLINQQLREDPTISNYKSILKNKKYDPYQNIWSMIADAKIIIASYGYLRQMRRILVSAEISLQNLHIIIDEAHNFARVQYHSIQKHHLLLFMKLYIRDPFLQTLYDQIQGLRILDREEIDNWEAGVANTLKLIDRADKMVISKDRQLQQLPKEIAHEILLELNDTMRDVFSNANIGNILVSQKALHVVDYQPEELFSSLLEAKRIVLLSGTISPAYAYRKLYGLPDSTILLDLKERNIQAIARDPNTFKAFYISSLNSIYRFRNDEMFEKFVTLLMEFYSRAPNHILVLGPSYSFIWNIAKLLAVPFVMETKTSSMKKINQLVFNSDKKLIILANQNGKLMEGNEWVKDGESLVSTVILTGLAMRVPMDTNAIIDHHRARILQDKETAQLFANQIPLAILAEQAFGRTIRSRDQKGALIILDDRVDSYLQRTLWLSRYTSRDELLMEFSSFWEGKEC
ncbi:MAG: DEAD/DEAH box helicase [Candidatus Heimdallarchaeota archaeon]|nr:DEAD/DEAH box helicase [Candidatus Heimdallarchaeota archaeon]